MLTTRLGIPTLFASATLFLSATSTIPADEPANPLELMSWTVGGRWVAELKPPTGDPLTIEMIAKWGEHKKTINYVCTFKTKSAAFSQYEGTYFWHPGKKKLALLEVDRQGNITEAVVEREGALLLQQNHSTTKDGKSQEFRVEIALEGPDAFTMKAFGEKDGKQVKMVQATYRREK